MYKKLCILLIFSKLKLSNRKYSNTILAKNPNPYKQIVGNLVNESEEQFSDLEIEALNMTSKAVGIDSESLLFAKLQEYSIEIHNLIFRRQYNDRRKITLSLCNTIRERIAAEIDGGEDYFCIDSKPIEVCRFARSKRCRRMMTDNEL